MTQLLNLKTGKPEAVADDDVAPSLAAGTHQAPPGQVTVVSPTGELGFMPQGSVEGALQSGFRIPTGADIKAFSNEAKYGGTSGEWKAFGAGVLRGGTFGGSDVALTKTGLVAPETLQGLMDTNPAASTTGEIGGAVGSALLMPELSPAGLVTKLGKATAAAVMPGAEAGGKLAQIASHALAGGVEGSLYGAGNSVTEAALGDPGAAAEHLVAHMGFGALIGGGLGGLLKAGQIATPEAVGKAKDAVSRGWRTLWGDAVPAGTPKALKGDFSPWSSPFPAGDAPAAAPGPGEPAFGTATAADPEALAATGTDGSPAMPDVSPPGPPPEAAPAPKPGLATRALAKVNEALTGTPAGETIETIQNRLNKGEILSPDEFEAYRQKFGAALQETHDGIEQASKEFNNVRPQEITELLKDADPAKTAIEVSRVSSGLKEIMAGAEARPELYDRGMVGELRDIAARLDGAASDADASAADHYLALNDAKKDLYDLQKTKEIMPRIERKTAELIREPYAAAKNSLEDQAAWGEQGARQARINDALNDHLAALKEFRKRFMEKVGNRRGGYDYVVNENKFGQFLNQINDSRGKVKANALRDFFRTSHQLSNVIDESYKNTPFETFDKAAMDSLLKKSVSEANRSYNVIAGQGPGMGHGGLGNLMTLGAVGHFGGPAAMAAMLAKKVAGAATNPEAVAAALTNIERASMTTGKVIGKAMKGIFKPVADQARKGVGFVVKESLTPGEKLEKIKAKIDETQDHISSAENLADTLDRATSDGAHAAPKTMAAVQATALRGLQFLQSKLPVTEPTSPFEEAPEPNPAQLMAFDRYHKTVHDPLSILDELRAGTLNPESVEAIRAVYPRLHQEITQAAVEHAAELKGATPYRTRLILSQFTGQPLTRSLTPAAMQTFQAATAQAAQEQGGAPHPTSAGMQHLNIAQRSATDFQKTSLKEG